METLLTTIYRRFRPRFGWPAFILLVLLMTTLLAATVEVGWVPQVGVVVPMGLIGFVLGMALASRSIHPVFAWLVLLGSGLALAILLLAGLWPPPPFWQEQGPTLADFVSQRLLIVGDRLATWAAAVAAGESSTDTLPFAVGLTLTAWLVGATLAWSIYRLGRPFLGLTAAGLAMGLIGYFGQAPLYWSVSLIGLAVLSVALLQYAIMEETWERTGVDYSTEAGAELIGGAALVGLLLMSLSFAIPSINVRAIAEAFQSQEVVVEAEAALERAFAGVEQPRLDDSASPAVERPSGVLPRAFLLGAGPDLLDTVVMTATVALADTSHVAAGTLPPLTARHWRGASYDVYTGRGWQRSPERETTVPAGELVTHAPDASSAIVISQSIEWAISPLLTRYTIGPPLTFDHATTTYWLGGDDLVRVSAASPNIAGYSATSAVRERDETALRRASMRDVPSIIMARYTALPPDVPRRVHDLARDVIGDSATPYDQALAIEQFLRQYPYSLDVSVPPPDVEITDYFLFDLQRGFCDYYATAMVVMARSVGLPARLATGFLGSPTAIVGQEIVRRRDAHSWAEIYFPGFGWVEFEPTAAINAPASPAANATFQPPAYGATDQTVPATLLAVPERAPQRNLPWPAIGVAGLLAFIIVGMAVRGFWRRRRSSVREYDPVESAFAQLEQEAARLGVTHGRGQTALEFADQLRETTERLGQESGADSAPLGQLIDRLTTIYAEHQYRCGAQPLDSRANREVRQMVRDIRALCRRIRWRRLMASLRYPWRSNASSI